MPFFALDIWQKEQEKMDYELHYVGDEGQGNPISITSIQHLLPINKRHQHFLPNFSSPNLSYPTVSTTVNSNKMVGSLMLWASLLLPLLFLFSTVAYRTNLEIYSGTAPEWGEQQRLGAGGSSKGCQGRVQVQELQSCKQYLRITSTSPVGYITLPTSAARRLGVQQEVEDNCRCKALKQIVGEEQQQPQQPVRGQSPEKVRRYSREQAVCRSHADWGPSMRYEHQGH